MLLMSFSGIIPVLYEILDDFQVSYGHYMISEKYHMFITCLVTYIMYISIILWTLYDI